jgi:hypothetical protein
MRPVKEVLYPSCSVCVFTLGYPSGLPIWPAPFPCAMAPTVKATKATATAAATFASTDSFIFPHSLILPPPIESVQSSPSEGFASCFDSQQPNGCLLSPHGPRLHRLMKVAMRNNSLRPIIFDDLRRSDCREKNSGHEDQKVSHACMTAGWLSGKDQRSSLNATVASGGKWMTIECSRPIHSRFSLWTPPKFPTLLPPYVSASVLMISR